MEPKPLAVLTGKQLPNTLTGAITSLHQRILQARAQAKTELTAHELDRLALRVCAEAGIKDLPGTELIDLCLKSWQDKFSLHMNRHELWLAFDMNVNGDLPERIEHYQCFSRDYFCRILNAYLQAKSAALQKAAQHTPVQQNPPPAADYSQKLLDALHTDKQLVSQGMEPAINFTIAAKLNLLAQLTEITINEKNITDYRQKAVQKVIAALNKQKHQCRINKKFGREVELINQVSRLKAGQLITEQDEAMIQAEVSKLIYCTEIVKWEGT